MEKCYAVCPVIRQAMCTKFRFPWVLPRIEYFSSRFLGHSPGTFPLIAWVIPSGNLPEIPPELLLKFE